MLAQRRDTVTLLQTQGSRILTENATSLFGLKLTKTLVGFTFQKDWAVSRGPIIIREDTEENLDEDHDER